MNHSELKQALQPIGLAVGGGCTDERLDGFKEIINQGAIDKLRQLGYQFKEINEQLSKPGSNVHGIYTAYCARKD